MTKIRKIFEATFKTLQLILVYILSLLLFLCQFNNSDFRCRWSFESCDFNSLQPSGDESVINTLKKIWRL